MSCRTSWKHFWSSSPKCRITNSERIHRGTTESSQKLWRDQEKKGMVAPRKEISSMGGVQKCINNKRYIKDSVLTSYCNSRTRTSKRMNFKNGNRKQPFHKTGNYTVAYVSTGGFESKSSAIGKRTQAPFCIPKTSGFTIFQAIVFWK